MQLTLKWLQKYLPGFEISDLDSFRHKLDTRLSEVDSIAKRGENLSGIIIAKVEKVDSHPTNEKLVVCTVDVGKTETHTIVTGAPNVYEGMYSLAVLPGGKVHNSETGTAMSITERKMGEVTSYGMLLAPDELDLSDEHRGVVELDDSLAPGTDVTQQLQDVVIEIENKSLAHRPDTFSHLGIARELSAIFKYRLEEQDFKLTQEQLEDAEEITITNKAEKACERYTALKLTNVTIKPSPLWLQTYLHHAGVKPINNVVDATNYVMLHQGQPLHAFDSNKLVDNNIYIRTASSAEELTTLDGETRKLPEHTLVIADKEKAIAIAGIMGGANSEVDAETTEILLESANFDMYSIRRSSRSLGLRSEASTRFEKGIDPNLTMTALIQAANLIVDIAGAEVASEIVDDYPHPRPHKHVPFDLNSIKRYLGIDMSKQFVTETLDNLGFAVIGSEKVSADVMNRVNYEAGISVQVPSWRRDINIQEDILEELVRMYGYENVEHTLPERDLSVPPVKSQRSKIHSLKNTLAFTGLTEIYTYSMVGDELYQQAQLDSDHLLTTQNPISPELSKLRDNLMPSLLEKARLNQNKYQEFGLFEVSRVALPQQDEQNIPKQPFVLAGIRVGNSEEEVIRELKYSLEQLGKHHFSDNLQVLGGHAAAASYLHPGKVGSLKLQEKEVGQMGIVHPLVVNNFDMEGKALAAFQVNLQPLLDWQENEKQLQPISNYPAVQRDLSFWQAEKTYLQETLNAIQNLQVDLLQNLQVIDTFIKDNRRSITIRLTLQSLEHTLEQDEIAEVLKRVEQQLQKQGHELR